MPAASNVERRNSSRTVPRSSETCFIVTTTNPSIVPSRVPKSTIRHHSTSTWQWSPTIRRSARGFWRLRDTVALRSDQAVLETGDADDRRAVHHHRVLDLGALDLQPAPIAEYGPMKLFSIRVSAPITTGSADAWS